MNNCELLHTAVKNGHLQIVETLFNCGSDVNTLSNITSGQSSRSLHKTSRNEQEELHIHIQ